MVLGAGQLRLLTALAAGLLVGCHGLFFELKAGTPECFKANPGFGHVMHGSYEADGPSEGVIVTLKGKAEKEMYKSVEPSGKFSIEVTEEAGHQLCFTSSSGQSQMVSFNFHIDEHGDSTPHDDKFVTKEHTVKIEELVAKLEAKANDILDQQQYAITREAVHRETAESTNARVMWWTLAEVAVLIILASFQAYYLRSYFEVKQIV
eukprot:TRINITY_DN55430_c0_g1_i1.p1 TRINITY_DN55430_c0_g1~~TRINITY_DN55430_c0_g1_i1.p1  ORF type:complete len:228 (-),score=63.95 TRINITY_DN55430_c0_g1_i1:62-679(-)